MGVLGVALGVLLRRGVLLVVLVVVPGFVLGVLLVLLGFVLGVLLVPK
jgi:hypothetical protein